MEIKNNMEYKLKIDDGTSITKNMMIVDTKKDAFKLKLDYRKRIEDETGFYKCEYNLKLKINQNGKGDPKSELIIKKGEFVYRTKVNKEVYRFEKKKNSSTITDKGVINLENILNEMENTFKKINDPKYNECYDLIKDSCLNYIE